ncbi:tRNA uridine 5-carboxymethylaminomethyl modification enzyme MnmG [Dissostichus eleginoides]|uniref:tRNA uridine 5-carboxymethylaminomethyl modification enzyme MnmG n=1 Tax=Dissostichus eleginoides TaxID=100907 RepID=A0AAD9C6H5_DISEL|nr:tRNA uridine 5-carboxymethylaminomethyl modification enzyme MnmG [Dissostichus eleginoides]
MRLWQHPRSQLHPQLLRVQRWRVLCRELVHNSPMHLQQIVKVGSSRCLGLQDKHNTQRGLQRKWSRASPW